MKINHKVSIHAYKYDGCLYRTFEFPKIIYVDGKITILSLNKTRIISQGKNNKFYHSNGNKDSFWIMFNDEWYNLIITFCHKKNKVIYYFNIASPFIYEDEAIKYVDLDLDVRLIFNKKKQSLIIKELDENDFKKNSIHMSYPNELINQTINAKNKLIDLIKKTKFFLRYDENFFKKFNFENV